MFNRIVYFNIRITFLCTKNEKDGAFEISSRAKKSHMILFARVHVHLPIKHIPNVHTNFQIIKVN